jgi:hypothetical protein
MESGLTGTVRLLMIAALSVALFGCAVMPKIETAPNDAETMYVLGVAAEHDTIGIHRITIESGKVVFRDDTEYFGEPIEGYVVWKMPATERSAIAGISEGGNWFNPCGDDPTIVFNALAGQVAYVGTLVLRTDHNELRFEMRNDLEAARAFVKRAYPQFPVELVLGSYDLMPTAARCKARTRAPY